MAKSKNSPHYQLTVSKDPAEALAALPLLLRGIALEKALKKAGQIVVRQAKQRLRPVRQSRVGVRQSRVGRKAGKKHLRDTIGVAYREYRSGNFLAVIGPQYPAGAHGHLVEFGHRNGINGQPVPPRPFMRPAFDETRSQVEQVMVSEIRKFAQEVGAQ